jgi:hypothetical protein
MSKTIEERLERLENLCDKIFQYSYKTGDTLSSFFHKELQEEIKEILDNIRSDKKVDNY